MKKCRAGNGMHSDNAFIEIIKENSQRIESCRVGVYHQNGIVEHSNLSLTEKSRVVLLFTRIKWPEVTFTFFPTAFSCEACISNHSTFNDEGRCPMEKLSVHDINFDSQNMHVFRCPALILDANLQRG